MTIATLNTNEYNSHNATYIDKVPKDIALLDLFEIQTTNTLALLQNIEESHYSYSYAEGKWTIKELVQHIIDNERIFAYRIFCIARHDKTMLANYDENAYIVPSKANTKSKETLINEYSSTRDYTIAMLKSIDQEDLKQIGFAAGSALSARAAAFVIIGHEIHHIEVLNERYLN